MTVQIFQPVGSGGGLTIGTTTITSGTTTRLLFDAAGVVSETDGVTWDATNKALTVGGATVTTSNPVLSLTQTWNAGAVNFIAFDINVTNTASAAGAKVFRLRVGGTEIFSVGANGNLNSASGTIQTDAVLIAGSTLFRSNSGNVYLTTNSLIYQVSAGIIGVRGSNSTTGGALSFIEQTAPAAPSTNGVYIYAQDNGAGKTQLMALFASGAAQQIAIEP